MKKKIVFMLLALGLLSSANAAKTGIGISSDMGLGICAQVNKNINLSAGNAGVAGDYLFLQEKIKKEFSWYVGGGAGFFWSDWTGNSGDIDVRMPVGVDWDFSREFDAFLQASPALRIGDKTGFGINGAIGLRYFF